MKPTVGTPTNPVEAVYAKNVYADNCPHFPIGAFVPFGGNTSIPVGFLLCNGASVARATYPKLFEILGTTYGAVDDAHFNLPDFTGGTFLEGAETAGDVKEPGLPNIEGRLALGNSVYRDAYTQGAFFTSGQFSDTTALGSNQPVNTVYFDASRSSAVYGNSDTVQPKSVTVRWFVKAFDGASEDSTDVEITKVANEKADRDLGNLTEIGRKAFFPSNTYVLLDDVPYVVGGKSEIIFTPPANGYVQVTGKISPYRGTKAIHYIYIAQSERLHSLEQEKASTHGLGIFMPVVKGLPCSISTMDMGATCVFFYAEGEV